MLTKKLLPVVLLTIGASLAFADEDGQWKHRHEDGQWKHHCSEDYKCVSAPEIDPGQAMSALALLGGSVAVLRGRRRKK